MIQNPESAESLQNPVNQRGSTFGLLENCGGRWSYAGREGIRGLGGGLEEEELSTEEAWRDCSDPAPTHLYSRHRPIPAAVKPCRIRQLPQASASPRRRKRPPTMRTSPAMVTGSRCGGQQSSRPGQGETEHRKGLTRRTGSSFASSLTIFTAPCKASWGICFASERDNVKFRGFFYRHCFQLNVFIYLDPPRNNKLSPRECTGFPKGNTPNTWGWGGRAGNAPQNKPKPKASKH